MVHAFEDMIMILILVPLILIFLPHLFAKLDIDMMLVVKLLKKVYYLAKNCILLGLSVTICLRIPKITIDVLHI